MRWVWVTWQYPYPAIQKGKQYLSVRFYRPDNRCVQLGAEYETADSLRGGEIKIISDRNGVQICPASFDGHQGFAIMDCDSEMPTHFSNDATRSVWAAEISRQMEESLTSREAETLCRKLLAGEITFEQYFAIVLSIGMGGSITHLEE